MDEKETIKRLLKEGKEAGQDNHPLYKLLETMAEQEGISTVPDYSTWKQVGVLTSEEIIKRKETMAHGRLALQEVESLQKRANVLKAEIEKNKADLWLLINRTHKLPAGGNWHLTDDGKILLEPGSIKRGEGE